MSFSKKSHFLGRSILNESETQGLESCCNLGWIAHENVRRKKHPTSQRDTA